VKKGDVVIRFDPTELRKDRDAGRNDGSTTDRKKDKEKAESGAAVTNLGRDATQARRELEVSKTFQSKDPELYSRNEIIESDIDVELAGRREKGAWSSRGLREELMQANLDLLAIDRRKAALKIGKAERELAQVDVKAPHDGVVVFQRDWKGDIPEVGRSVWSGLVLAEIPEVAELQAEVWVLEPDVGGLAEGRSAKVVVEAQPDRVLEAKVKSVDALAKPRLRGVPVQYFGVTLSLPTDTRTMKPGQRVVATLFPGDEKDVLAVPRQAVFERDGKSVVFKQGGRGFEAVPVVLGASTAGRVVVTKGLSDGDTIALADPESRRAPASKAP
jgi:multidrug efflux pump subunit AcrA (membrane-fusion protein)